MTNIQLKAQIDAAVTNKVTEDSITPTDVGNNMTAVVDYVDQQDALSVHLDGTEIITGAKTFTLTVEAAGFVYTGGTSSQFLKADGSIDTDTYANDFTVVHKDGSETITGTKLFITDPGAPIIMVQNATSSQNGINIDNIDTGGGIFVFNADDGAGIIVDNDLGGVGIAINNDSTLEGIYIDNTNTGDGLSILSNVGRALYIENIGSTTSLEINNLDGNAMKVLGGGNGTALQINNNGGSAKGIVVDNSNANTGVPITVRKNAVDKITLEDNGDITAIRFIKPGGTSAQFLMADGSINSATYINDADVVKLSASSIKTSKLTLVPASGDALVATSIDGIGVIASSSSASNPGLSVLNSATGDIAQFFNASLLKVASVAQNGSFNGTQFNVTSLNFVPPSAASTGTVGEIRFTADHIYLCVAANTWKRVAIATF